MSDLWGDKYMATKTYCHISNEQSLRKQCFDKYGFACVDDKIHVWKKMHLVILTCCWKSQYFSGYSKLEQMNWIKGIIVFVNETMFSRVGEGQLLGQMMVLYPCVPSILDLYQFKMKSQRFLSNSSAVFKADKFKNTS